MKFNKIFMASIFLLAVLMVGAVSASDNITEDLSVNDEDVLDSSVRDDNLKLETNESQGGSDLPDNRKDIDFNVPKEFSKYEEFKTIRFDSIIESTSQYREISVDSKLIDAYLDGKQVNVSLYYTGYYSLDVYPNDLSLGKHILNLSFRGNDLYKPLNKTYEFEIVKFLISTPEVISADYGGNYVSVYMPKNAKGILACYADGNLFKKVNVTEFDNFDYIDDIILLPSLSLGSHDIEFRYAKDPKYASFSKKVKVDATYKVFTNIDQGYIYGFDGDGEYYFDDMAEFVQNVGCIFIELHDDMKSKPKVTIDGVEVNVKKMAFPGVSDNCYVFDEFSKLDIGEHELVVSYNDSKYPLKTFEHRFSVKPIIFLDSTFIYYEDTFDEYYAASRDVVCGDGSKFVLKLPSDAKGNLSLYIYPRNDDFEVHDSKWLYNTTPLVNGSASSSVDDLEVGRYYADLVYTGDDYNVSRFFCYFNKNMDFIYPESMIYGQDKYLIIKSHKTDNRLLNISNRPYYNDGVKFSANIQLVNGTGKLSLKKLPWGDVHLEIDDGTGSDYISIDVKPDCKLTGGKNINIYYGAAKNYYVKVTDLKGVSVGKGKTVEFKIGNQVYKAKTNANGIAILRLTAKPAKYKIIASYRGAKTSNALVVKHTLGLAKVDVKKSSKKLVLKASLRQGKKLLKYKRVTFIFNGKIYTSKTNAKGIVKVTVNSNVLKKLKVGKTITYQAIYLKDTVKRPVKVKK